MKLLKDTIKKLTNGGKTHQLSQSEIERAEHISKLDLPYKPLEQFLKRADGTKARNKALI